MIIARAIDQLIGKNGFFKDAERRENNLNQMRLAAALAVLFAHCWPLATSGAIDPVSRGLSALTGKNLYVSALAVNMFFVISGYLVTKSAIMRANILEYAWARILRIYPALIVNVLVVSLLFGSLVTTLTPAAYFASPDLWQYITRNVIMWNAAYDLPGVFEGTATGVVNGSLWTLPLEIRCYLGVGILYLIGAFKQRVAVTLMSAALYGANVAFPEAKILGPPAAAQNFAYFIVGAHFFLYRELLPARPIFPAAILLLGLVTPWQHLSVAIGSLGFSWLILWMGLTTPVAPSLEHWLGDPSYGIYIWAYPIAQLALLVTPSASPWLVLLYCLPATVLLGVISWRFLEKPALAHKADFAAMSVGHLQHVRKLWNMVRGV